MTPCAERDATRSQPAKDRARRAEDRVQSRSNARWSRCAQAPSRQPSTASRLDERASGDSPRVMRLVPYVEPSRRDSFEDGRGGHRESDPARSAIASPVPMGWLNAGLFDGAAFAKQRHSSRVSVSAWRDGAQSHARSAFERRTSRGDVRTERRSMLWYDFRERSGEAEPRCGGQGIDQIVGRRRFCVCDEDLLVRRFEHTTDLRTAPSARHARGDGDRDQPFGNRSLSRKLPRELAIRPPCLVRRLRCGGTWRRRCYQEGEQRHRSRRPPAGVLIVVLAEPLRECGGSALQLTQSASSALAGRKSDTRRRHRAVGFPDESAVRRPHLADVHGLVR